MSFHAMQSSNQSWTCSAGNATCGLIMYVGNAIGYDKLALNSHYGPTVLNAPSQEIVIVLMEDVHGLGLQRRLPV